MTALPPFSGHGASCPKCGSLMSTTFVDGFDFDSAKAFAGTDPSLMSRLLNHPGWEILGRKCLVCGHRLLEAPLDAQPDGGR